jgi:anionic cell wall polymer biosynthesis LytR-Cps2A-Psr (LCP) family protein
MPYTLDGRVPRSRDANRYFAAGNQHLNGYRTMLLARMRPQGDFERMEIQNLILRAVMQKISSPAMLLRLPDLIGSFHGAVQTDLGAAELSYLACLAAILDSEDIAFESFPDDMFTVGRVQDPVLGNTSILEADFEAMKTYVRKFQAGLSLTADEEEGPIHP